MIHFLLKGLLRDRSRSLFPSLMVIAGSFLTVFLYCFINGVMDDMIRTNAVYDTGHLKIMTRAYYELKDQAPNDLALLGSSETIDSLQKDYPQFWWLPRIRFGGLLDVPDESGETLEQGPVIGLALRLIDTDSSERQLLNIKDALVRGAIPSQAGEILISRQFAEKLNITTGQTVTLIGSTMNGSMAFHNFTVSGLVHFGIAALDRGMMLADISDIQIALDMNDGAGEIYGFSKDNHYDSVAANVIKGRFNEQYSVESDDFSPLMITLEQQNDLGDYLALMGVFGFIITSLFIFVMSLVLWNSGLMNSLRRYGEVGLRLALGEPRGTIYRRMILESIMIGLIGTVIGSAIAILLAYYMQYHGLDFSDLMNKSSMMISSVARARVTPFSFIIGFFPGLVAPVIGTIFAGIGIYKRQTSQLFKEMET